MKSSGRDDFGEPLSFYMRVAIRPGEIVGGNKKRRIKMKIEKLERVSIGVKNLDEAGKLNNKEVIPLWQQC